MDPQGLAKRRQVMARSRALGHCICDPQKPCPCDDLKMRDCCPCAGERMPVTTGPVRLTEHVHNAGCASKIGRRDLESVLAGLPEIDDQRVVLGRQAGDDAGVIMLDERRGSVLTVDVFTPPVDDPATFGRIAAANSISDLYAMGAHPEAALSIVGFPIHTLPAAALHEMLAGGIAALAEVGVSVIGGHSLNDAEIKFGFALLGSCPPQGWFDHAGVRPGDDLVLTKPIGGGLLAFAHQIGRSSAAGVAAWTAAMCAFNRLAGEQLAPCGAHACTDVTGFSLLGHLSGMTRKSAVAVRLDFDAIPLFPGVAELARQEVIPGGVERNREAVDPERLDFGDLTPAQEAVLFSPETSGGLLVALPPERAEDYCRRLRAGGVEAVVIGRAEEVCEGGHIRVASQRSGEWGRLDLVALGEQAPERAPAAAACCSDSGVEQALDPPRAQACCAGAAESGRLPNPAADAAFGQYMRAVSSPGALDAREKALISLALSVAGRCGPCIRSQFAAARSAGASDAQVAEAVDLGVAFGGAPAMSYYRSFEQES